MKLNYLLFVLSICTSILLEDLDSKSLDFVSLKDLDLKSFYNAPASKLKVVIVKLDELIKHAQDHETVLSSNVSKYRVAYLKKKGEHEKSVIKNLLATHEAGLAKSAEAKLNVAQKLAKQHYDTAKTIRSGADTAATLAALYTVRSIIAKLLTGTHYPTAGPTKAPTHRPTSAPTQWVAPTPPTNAPTKAPTKPPTKAWVTNEDSLFSTAGYNRTTNGVSGDGKFHGLFGAGQNVVKYWTNLPSHTKVTLKLRYWAIDSWDNEYGYVFMSNSSNKWAKVWTSPKKWYTKCPSPGVAYSGSFPQRWGSNTRNEQCYFDVSRTIPHTPSTFGMLVASNLNSGISDESFAFNHVSVTLG